MTTGSHRQDLDRFYDFLARLERKVGLRQLKDCHGRMGWPRRGVYFFFEPGEFRTDGVTPRVVRVGTHAVSALSKAALWTRLRQHRGRRAGGGHHRASVFRKLVGAALLSREENLGPAPPSWGIGNSASRDVCDGEAHIEEAVSRHIGAMPFLCVSADDDPGRSSIRSAIEINTIGLLSCCSPTGRSADPPSADWLGRHCTRWDRVQRSGLWNNDYVDASYDPSFFDILEQGVAMTK